MSRQGTTWIGGRALQVALVLLALGITPRAATGQFSVSHSELTLKSNVTAYRSTVVRITNSADQETEAVLQVQDWHRDETGNNAFLPLGTGSGSCREHLKVTPSTLRIAAHETEHVRVSFDGEYDKSCWAVVFVQPNEQRAAAGGPANVLRPASPGVKVYVQPEWAVREGVVQSLSYQREPSSVELLFRNTGHAHLEPFGAVEIRNAKNLVVATVDVSRFPIAPADQRRLRVPLPRLAPGRYTAVALFDYKGSDIAERELPFEIR
jgi:hypothetical protein